MSTSNKLWTQDRDAQRTLGSVHCYAQRKGQWYFVRWHRTDLPNDFDNSDEDGVTNGPTLRHWSPDLRVLHLNRRAPMASRGAARLGSIFFMFVDPRRRAIRQHQGA